METRIPLRLYDFATFALLLGTNSCRKNGFIGIPPDRGGSLRKGARYEKGNDRQSDLRIKTVVAEDKH